MIMGYWGQKNASKCFVSSNEDIEIFVDKYLTINQIVFKNKIHNAQIHQHK
jgi:hypothetical protein